MTGDAADATAADPRAQAREDLARMVLLAQQGDQDAWRELFRRRLNLVHTVCLNVTQHAADAEDASQETFLQAFRQVGQCRNPMAFTGWLKAVAAREALKIAKKRDRDRTQPDTSEGGVEQMPAAADGPDRAHERIEEIELVRDALAGVPVKYRAVLSTHISNDVVGQALAEVFQVNRNTRDQWMHRARKYLGFR
jgi:RNA polymerase sigma-70 factor, ECF subfamily